MTDPRSIDRLASIEARHAEDLADLAKHRELESDPEWQTPRDIRDLLAETVRLRKLYYLAAQDVIFFSTYDPAHDTWPDGRYWSPCVLLNDRFAYATADGEVLPDSEIDRLIAAYDRFGHDGVIAWAALRRGTEPIPPCRTPKYHEAKAALEKME